MKFSSLAILALTIIVTGCTTVSPTAGGINLYAPHPIHIANPNFREGSEAEQWNREYDDFIIGVQTPTVPNSSFKVRWEIDGEVIEEVTMKPNSQSWTIGMRWGKAYPGDHILRVIIDPEKMVTETNEEDNEHIVAFSIPD